MLMSKGNPISRVSDQSDIIDSILENVTSKKKDLFLKQIEKELEKGGVSVNVVSKDRNDIITINIMPGTSIKTNIKKIFKQLGLDSDYDLRKIDRTTFGDSHDYEIPKLK